MLPRRPAPSFVTSTKRRREAFDERLCGEADRRARRGGAGRGGVRPAGARLPTEVRALPRARPRRGRSGGGVRGPRGLVHVRRRRRAVRRGCGNAGRRRPGEEATDRAGRARRPYPRDRLQPGRRVHAPGRLPPRGPIVSAAAPAAPRVVPAAGETLWFLGTVARLKLTGEETGGRFALWEGVLPNGAAPPLHSHPQDETFYILEGDVTVWIVEEQDAGDEAWVATHGRTCRAGAAAFAPAGVAHTFRVESDTARMLFLSTPAGIEDYVRALAEPARWPWLPAAPDGPRVPPERLEAVERQLGVVRHGPAPTREAPQPRPCVC